MRRILRLMFVAAGPYTAEFRKTMRYSVAATLVQAAAYATFIPLLAATAADPVDTGRAWMWVGALAVLVVVEGLLRAREQAFNYDTWPYVTQAIRRSLGERLRAMPQQELGRRAAGDLTTLVGSNVISASTSISLLSTLFVQIVTVPAVVGLVVLLVDWRLGAVLAVAVVLAIPMFRWIQRMSNLGFRSVNEADAAAADRIVEYVQGLPVLKATGQAGADSPRLVEVLTEQQHTQSAANRSATVPVAGAQLLVQLAMVALVVVGAALVLDAELTVPLLVAVIVAAARFAEPLAVAAVLVKVFELSEAALSRIGAVLAIEPLPVKAGGSAPTSFDVRFEGVSFSYDGQEKLLRGVDLVVPERSLTALVGPSGSGKTTITKLITRYADPQEGVVRIGGVDLATLAPEELLRHVAVVFQDVYLFDDTIRANIAMGRPDATDDEIQEAARAANVHTFVDRLPHGYDTRVGEIGSALSGGERQRISIARAILKDAPIVLLDEPTAALDTESEVVVQEAIDHLVKGKTVVVIAHRLSTVVGADQIVVIEDGVVAQSGRHAALIADGNGRYARMWQAQLAAREWHVPAGVNG
ncbi:ABC transporter ATP-binding protein [Kribbella sandramycini]|uniref:ABC transporter ATP-binding protein n=1 Tax=Kribbella sandramycini TaxID=60450 RepID=A0A7Y4KXL3_9ACTN|nr:ABC transporter ATP-binding protein [Kribbella sandramycini]MBB6569655.1 ATP-binding cassette subfamily B protein [Kribbella sandramycini]NOL40513.1 ABC transporter ATP-binding protein [Kribbella sandramycini]